MRIEICFPILNIITADQSFEKKKMYSRTRVFLPCVCVCVRMHISAADFVADVNERVLMRRMQNKVKSTRGCVGHSGCRVGEVLAECRFAFEHVDHVASVFSRCLRDVSPTTFVDSCGRICRLTDE